MGGEALDRRRHRSRPRRGRALRPLRPPGVRRPGALADRLLPRLRDLRADRRHALGGDGGAPVDRHEGHRAVRLRRAEGALPARAGERPQARRLRADRARRRVGRLQRSVPRRPAARRRLGAERGEALHRQRRHRRRLRHLRPRRGRRQGPPHRADPREGHEGVRGRRALRHDGPAGQRPAPPLLQRRAGAAGERPRRAGRRIPDRDAHPQQRSPQPRHRVGGSDQGSPRPDHRPRQGAAAVRSCPGRLRAGPGQDRLDGLLPVRAGVDDLPDLRARRRRGARLLAGVGDLQGLGDRVPLVRRQPRDAAARRRGLHADGPLREGSARHPHLPDLRRRQRRLARFHRPDRDEAARRGDVRARGAGARGPDRIDRSRGRLRQRADPAPGPPRHASPAPIRASPNRRTPSPTRCRS